MVLPFAKLISANVTNPLLSVLELMTGSMPEFHGVAAMVVVFWCMYEDTLDTVLFPSANPR